jgi:hypothetical protein
MERIGSLAIILEPKIYCNVSTGPKFTLPPYLLGLVSLIHTTP